MSKSLQIQSAASVKQKVGYFNQLAVDKNATVSTAKTVKAVAVSNVIHTPQTSGSGKIASPSIAGERVLGLVKKFSCSVKQLNQSNRVTLNLRQKSQIALNEAEQTSGSSKTASLSTETDRVIGLLKECSCSAKQLDDDSLSHLHQRLQVVSDKARQLSEKVKQINSMQSSIQELAEFRGNCLSTVRTELRKLQVSDLEALVLDSDDGTQRVITQDTLVLVKDNLSAFFSLGIHSMDIALDQAALTPEQQEKIVKDSGVVVHQDDQMNRRHSFQLMLECMKADDNFKNLAFLVKKFGGDRGCFATMQRNFFGFSDDAEDFSQWNTNLTFNENLFNLAMSLEDKSSATAIYHGLIDTNGLIGNEKSSEEEGATVAKIVKLEDIISFFAFESNAYCTIEGYEDFFETRDQERQQFLAEGGSFD